MSATTTPTTKTTDRARISVAKELSLLDQTNTRLASLIANCFLLRDDFIEQLAEVMRYNDDIMTELLRTYNQQHITLNRFTPDRIVRCEPVDEPGTTRYIDTVIDLELKLHETTNTYATLGNDTGSRPYLKELDDLLRSFHGMIKTCKFTVNSYL